MAGAVSFFKKIRESFKNMLLNSVNNPGSEFKNFKRILERLDKSEINSDEFEAVLGIISTIKEETKKNLIVKYHSNLVNMSKVELEESIRSLFAELNNDYKLDTSTLMINLKSDPKDIQLDVLKKITYVQSSVIILAGSIKYCAESIGSGVTNSIINDLMQDQKQIDNFGIN